MAEGVNRGLRTLAALRAAGLLPASSEVGAATLDAVVARYPVALSSTLAAVCDPRDPADPLLRQFVPAETELVAQAGERGDPIGDDAHMALPGLVHRYPDRVLLLPTLACAVYCRFCFRRERVGQGDGGLTPAQEAAALDYIASHPAIREVIVTGGDPLVLSAAHLRRLLEALSAIPHLEIIRIHSRVPVADPVRITPEHVAVLAECTTALFLAIHANHPREFTPAAAALLRQLNRAGVVLLGQSVLLRGVNDQPEVLEALMRTFLAHRIKPYYLHHLDPAPGTGHFRVRLAEGQALVQGLRGRLSGLGQPDYVIDIPGGFGKSLVAGTDLSTDDPDATDYRIRDWRGQLHDLPAGW